MDSSVHSIAKLFRNGLPDQALAYRLASDPLTKATDATELTDNTAPQSALLQVPEALSHPSPLSLSPFLTSASGRWLAGRFVFQSDREREREMPPT